MPTAPRAPGGAPRHKRGTLPRPPDKCNQPGRRENAAKTRMRRRIIPGVLHSPKPGVHSGLATSPPPSAHRVGPLSTSLLGCRAVRVGAPMMATIVLSVLLCAAGGAEPAAVSRPPSQPAVEATDRYLVLTRRALALREERRSAELGLAIARRSLVRTERRLGARLRALYESGSPDTVE